MNQDSLSFLRLQLIKFLGQSIWWKPKVGSLVRWDDLEAIAIKMQLPSNRWRPYRCAAIRTTKPASPTLNFIVLAESLSLIRLITHAWHARVMSSDSIAPAQWEGIIISLWKRNSRRLRLKETSFSWLKIPKANEKVKCGKKLLKRRTWDEVNKISDKGGFQWITPGPRLLFFLIHADSPSC